ncbi:hypothetical protein HanPI659440_Chr15g0592311 [Helianthus annuus]|nr:hypothetical protein HanPI659440_Chr15g0592311 [Helianthus annuus]
MMLKVTGQIITQRIFKSFAYKSDFYANRGDKQIRNLITDAWEKNYAKRTCR